MNISILNKFVLFLRDLELFDESLTFGNKVIIVVKLYLYLILFSCLINFLTVFIENDSVLLSEIVQNSDKNIFFVFLLYVVVPIYEELMFRLFLTRFDKRKFIISISLLFSYALYWFFYGLGINLNIYKDPIMHYVYLILFAMFLFVIISYVIAKVDIKRLSSIWNKYFIWVFYLVSITFTLLHYKNSGGLVADFFYLLPLFLFSLMLGFIRINLGIMYSIFFHLLFNLPNTLVRLLHF